MKIHEGSCQKEDLMNITESLKQRRSYYHINKILPVSEETIIEQIKEITELVPD